VNPEHDGALLPIDTWRPDVQPQTVFAVATEIPLKQKSFFIVIPDSSSTTVVDSDNLSLLWQWFSGVRDGEANIGLEA
jgi:hypothetical protein